MVLGARSEILFTSACECARRGTLSHITAIDLIAWAATQTLDLLGCQGLHYIVDTLGLTTGVDKLAVVVAFFEM